MRGLARLSDGAFRKSSHLANMVMLVMQTEPRHCRPPPLQTLAFR